MMKCENAAPVMDAYLDGELELTACVAVEEHLATCEGCRRRLEERGELVSRIREEATRYEASAFLATRVRAQLRAEGAERQASFFESIREIALWAKRRHSVASASPPPDGLSFGKAISRLRRSVVATALTALALVGITLVILDRTGGDRQIGEEAIANHVRSLQASHLMDVVSTDRHTVKPWFAGRIDFSPPVVDLQQAGYPLVGGRLDFLDHHEVAALVYQRRKHFINLFIWPARAGETGERAYQADGYRIQGWTAGGMNFLAVSELGAAEMREFAEGIKGGGGSVRE